MISLSRILVDIDAAAPKHPALDQAVDLALRCGASVKIVDVLPEVPGHARRFVSPGLEEDAAAYRRERLAAVAAGITSVATTTELLRGRPATAIVREVLRSDHQLVVRSHVRDLAGPRRPFGAIDMELLRQCPCPVWLVGPDGERRPRRILAAVHTHTNDETEQQLNASILDLAVTLKDIEGGELTLLEAWSLFGEELLRPRLSDRELARELETLRLDVEQDVARLVASFADRVAGASTEVLKGAAEDVIPAFVGSHGIDVVVMGTVARTGVAGLVMGNTAERVLQRLQGSVLAVKPPGFISPIVE